MKIIIIILLAGLNGFGQEIKTRIPEIIKNYSCKTLVIKDVVSPDKYEEPLYVVDGEITTAEEVKKIKPETIESFEILKDTNTPFCSGRKVVIVITSKKRTKERIQK